MADLADDLWEKRGILRRAVERDLMLLGEALHAHKRGDKAHVVEDHLERVIASLRDAYQRSL